MPGLYTPLPPRTIRVLRLMPLEKSNAGEIQCELTLLRLPEKTSEQLRSQLYEALSYVWGPSVPARSIRISDHSIDVGQNLHQALLRLRHRSLDRPLWVDALCINQKDNDEKKDQIPLMLQIYQAAKSVIIWLGEEADDSDKALDVIIKRGANSSRTGITDNAPRPSLQGPPFRHTAHSQDDPNPWYMDHASENAVCALLKRPWFSRIWIVQEASSSSFTSIVCGSTEVKGHAFCLGVLAIAGLLQKHPDVFGRVAPVVSAMVAHTLNPSSMNLRPISELVDMYHTRDSTVDHDMLYALQGLSSDNFDDVGILLDYSQTWDQVFYSLLRFLLPRARRFHVPAGALCAGIIHDAILVSKVIAVERFALQGGYQILRTEAYKSVQNYDCPQTWHIPDSAIPVQADDFVCLFEGLTLPAVVRARGDYFEIIIIAARSPWAASTGESSGQWKHSPSDVEGFTAFPFIWDWERGKPIMEAGRDKLIIEEKREVLHQNLLSTVLDLHQLTHNRHTSLANLRRVWTISMAISPLLKPTDKEIKKVADARVAAWEAYREAHALQAIGFDKARGLHLVSWAALNGCDQLVRDLVQGGVDLNLIDDNGRTALSYAAEAADIDLVQFFLENGARGNQNQLYIDSPLSRAIDAGANKPAQHLLFLFDMSKKVQQRWFLLAVRDGLLDLVRLLLRCGFDAKSGRLDAMVPLQKVASAFATGLHSDFSHLSREELDFLECHEWSDDEPSDFNPRSSPVLYAIDNCSDDMVRLFVEYGVDVREQAFLRERAFLPGSVLLESRQKLVYPLHHALQTGAVATVPLLLSLGAQTTSQDSFGFTPLHHAICLPWHAWRKARGLGLGLGEDTGRAPSLLEHGSDINAEDDEELLPPPFPLHSNLEKEMARILLEYGSDIDAADDAGITPLMYAVQRGKREVMLFLLESGADINRQDYRKRSSLAYLISGGKKNRLWNEGFDLLLKHGATFEAKDWGHKFAERYDTTPEKWPWIWPSSRIS